MLGCSAPPLGLRDSSAEVQYSGLIVRPEHFWRRSWFVGNPEVIERLKGSSTVNFRFARHSGTTAKKSVSWLDACTLLTN